MQFIHRRFKETDVWSAPYAQVDRELRGAIDLCDAWLKKIKVLQPQLDHRWNGQKYEDERTLILKGRIRYMVESTFAITDVRYFRVRTLMNSSFL